MNLENFLKELCEALGFTPEEQEEAVRDLEQAISLQILSDIKQKGILNSELQDFEKAAQAKQFGGLQMLISQIKNHPEFATLYVDAMKTVVANWLSNMNDTISEDERQNALKLLRSLNQQEVN